MVVSSQCGGPSFSRDVGHRIRREPVTVNQSVYCVFLCLMVFDMRKSELYLSFKKTVEMEEIGLWYRFLQNLV